MNASLTANAFRILSLPADTESRDIYRQQQRLQNALELGDPSAAVSYRFLPDLNIGAELVLDAIHRLEKDRLAEELFWVHELGGEFQFKSKTTDEVLAQLRAMCVRDTRREAVAQHNLAVILTSLACELSGSRRFDYWKEALAQWRQTLHNTAFWAFMVERAGKLAGTSRPSVRDLRNETKSSLQAAITDEVWAAINNRDYGEIRAAVQLITAHKDFLDAQMLDSVTTKLVKDGTVAIGSVLDRLAELKQGTDPHIVRRALQDAEAQLGKISSDFADTLKILDPAGAFVNWSDIRAGVIERLSVAYYNTLHDPEAALRLNVEAQKAAHNGDIKKRLEAGWDTLQVNILWNAGDKLFQAGRIEEAEEKLRRALPLASDTQIPQITQALENCRQRRLLGEPGQKPALGTMNGIGTTLYGRRDYDAGTNTYVATQWLVFLFLPIFPLAAYRVRDAGRNSYQIFGRVPVSPFAKKYRWVVAIAALVLMLHLFFSNDPPTPSSAAENPAVGRSQSNFGGGLRAEERQAIEAERVVLQGLADDLSARKRQLEKERMDLDMLEITSIPEHNRKVPGYNKKLRMLQADIQNFQQRQAGFNARVERFNSNR